MQGPHSQYGFGEPDQCGYTNPPSTDPQHYNNDKILSNTVISKHLKQYPNYSGLPGEMCVAEGGIELVEVEQTLLHHCQPGHHKT